MMPSQGPNFRSGNSVDNSLAFSMRKCVLVWPLLVLPFISTIVLVKISHLFPLVQHRRPLDTLKDLASSGGAWLNK